MQVSTDIGACAPGKQSALPVQTPTAKDAGYGQRDRPVDY